ncbi:unnamed protein product, partial [Rotaria magnacalcarata]
STSPGNPEQQYVQHQYGYQSQTTNQGGHQYYSEASGVEHHQQQLTQETGDAQAGAQQGQDVNYAQYTRSGAELADDQQGG